LFWSLFQANLIVTNGFPLFLHQNVKSSGKSNLNDTFVSAATQLKIIMALCPSNAEFILTAAFVRWRRTIICDIPTSVPEGPLKTQNFVWKQLSPNWDIENQLKRNRP
jgi:hypothetical protein